MQLRLKKVQTKFNIFSKPPHSLRNLERYITKTQGIVSYEVDGKMKFAFSGAGVVKQYTPLSVQGLEITDEEFNTENIKMRPSTYQFLLGKYKVLKVPEQILNAGGDHVGSLDYENGVFYTPWEDGDTYLNPAIVAYNAELNSTAFGFLSTDILKDGAPFCAVEDGTIYITKYTGAEHLLQFDVSDLKNKDEKIEPKKVIKLDYSECPRKICRAKAGKVFQNTLYILEHNGESTQRIFAIDIKTGKVSKNVIEFEPVDRYGDKIDVEAESITFVEKDDGLSLVMVGNYRFEKWNATIIFYTFGVKL